MPKNRFAWFSKPKKTIDLDNGKDIQPIPEEIGLNKNDLDYFKEGGWYQGYEEDGELAVVKLHEKAEDGGSWVATLAKVSMMEKSWFIHVTHYAMKKVEQLNRVPKEKCEILDRKLEKYNSEQVNRINKNLAKSKEELEVLYAD